jgi:hypothetical protein
MVDSVSKDMLSTLNYLTQVFKRGPGYKKFPLEGTVKYGKHPATMFISSSGQGLLHYNVVESHVEKLRILVNKMCSTII